MKKGDQRALFERTIVIQGTHANTHENLLNTGLFSNNHEVAEFAMMVGILFEKTEKKNHDTEIEFKIQKETMRDSGELILRLYRFCMLLHDKYVPQDIRIERAFNYDERGEEAFQYEEILESYMRGGYSILEEKILRAGPHGKNKMTDLDYISNEYDLLKEIDELMKSRISIKKSGAPLSSKDILSLA